MAEGPNVYGQGPEAGWYPDPEGAGLRWWDGTAWTSHLHAPESAPATEQAPAGGRRPPARALVLAALLIAAVAAGAFLLFRPSDDDSSTGTPASIPAQGTAGSETPEGAGGLPPAFDASAKEEVHSAQVAIETYATEHGGSYSGATVRVLHRIEPSLPPGLGVVGTGSNSYALTMQAKSGDVFSIVRRPNGKMAFTCAPPGHGGCPPSGRWE